MTDVTIYSVSGHVGDVLGCSIFCGKHCRPRGSALNKPWSPPKIVVGLVGGSPDRGISPMEPNQLVAILEPWMSWDMNARKVANCLLAIELRIYNMENEHGVVIS